VLCHAAAQPPHNMPQVQQAATKHSTHERDQQHMPLCNCLYCAFHAMTLKDLLLTLSRPPNGYPQACIACTASRHRSSPAKVTDTKRRAVLRDCWEEADETLQWSMHGPSNVHNSMLSRHLGLCSRPLHFNQKGLRRTHLSLCSPDTKHSREMQQSSNTQHSRCCRHHSASNRLLPRSLQLPSTKLCIPSKNQTQTACRSFEPAISRWQSSLRMECKHAYGTSPLPKGVYPTRSIILPTTPTNSVNRIQYTHLACTHEADTGGLQGLQSPQTQNCLMPRGWRITAKKHSRSQTTGLLQQRGVSIWGRTSTRGLSRAGF
jgi:hypothetical protein